jgi:hypothetical protein
MRWSKRLRNIKAKVSGNSHDDYDRGKPRYSSRGQHASLGCYYDDEESNASSWDGPDSLEGENRDDDVDSRDEGAEYRSDDGEEISSENELVTRDQVLDELRAQAAAEALGKSLEQMGYNLDNCDSFYSLSDKEEQNQRYNISRHNSEASDRSKLGSTTKRRQMTKSKTKKKKTKSPRSRHSAPLDDYDEEFTLREDLSGHRHSFGEYETYVSSSDSDVDYSEDETSFTTGLETALTGKTSRYSRFTGKKSALTRKSAKSKRHKKRDHETYYSRGTKCTTGESSYGKTLHTNSSLSSSLSSER